MLTNFTASTPSLIPPLFSFLYFHTRCILRCVQHLQFLGGEPGERSVPGGPQLQPGLAAAPQHAAAQPEPAAAQPAGHTSGPAAEAAQQV